MWIGEGLDGLEKFSYGATTAPTCRIYPFPPPSSQARISCPFSIFLPWSFHVPHLRVSAYPDLCMGFAGKRMEERFLLFLFSCDGVGCRT